MRPFKNILDMVGSTPILRLRHLVPEGSAEVYVKLEGVNPGGSVKDRIALSMVVEAERSGRLKPGGTMVEPTSGNTGIGLAMVAALRGYRLILTMPETMTVERRQMLAAFGAECVLTPGAKGMKGAVEEAERRAAEDPSLFMPRQFDNPANPEVHRRTTAVEIIQAFGGVPEGFVAGVGTGGTITGVGEAFRFYRKDVRIVAVEPAESPVLSGGQPGPHKIGGIGAGFIPSLLNTKIYDTVLKVSSEEAAGMARELALKEGIFAGISSGAAVQAALRVAAELGPGKRVVTVLADRGEKYLSTALFTKPA